MSEMLSAEKATAQLEEFGYKQELSRTVSTFDLVVYGLVFMVPIAPWAIFGTVYNESKGMVPLVYLIGVIAMIFTALSYSQMAKAFPLAGGVFSYVGRGINPSIGFFAGWLMLLDYLLIPTLLYIMASESMVGLFPGTPRWMWGLVFVILNVSVNLMGVSSLKIMNRIFLVMELCFVIAFFAIAIIGLSGNKLPEAHWSMDPIWNSDYVTPSLLAAALSIAVLSFLGFDGISTLAEETTSGSKAPGKAMIIGLITVAALFISQTWLASMLAGNFHEVPEDKVGNYFFDLVQQVAGTGVVNAFFVCNVLAVGIANSMAAQAATSRLLFSMARDKQIPTYLRHINSKKVPSYAILTVGALSAVLVVAFAGQIDTMSSMVNFGALASFSLLHIAVIWYYLKTKQSRNFISHLVLPLIGFCIIFYVLINAGVEAHVAGGAWFLVGCGVFAYNKLKGNSIEIRGENESVDF
ncbi:APC family permease [Corynebacterium sp. SCR221107]|uniref:APC family permease n=1 Tax=Corynebacterium sp. SCR221107 TaxID=3017361 RepID=UPI0022EC91DE|nr:APC family permease [Corynebacterium sp. SCR221107]WBT08712.1 APC family permease [Corynebacterium sp. SCR221107]